MTNEQTALREAVLVTVDALEYTHPTAIISTDDSDKCDIRVQSAPNIGVIVTAYQPYEITDEDLNTIETSSIDIGTGVGEEFMLITKNTVREESLP